MLSEMRRVFGDRFYVELQRHGLAPQALAEPELVAWVVRRAAATLAGRVQACPREVDRVPVTWQADAIWGCI